MTTEEMLLNIVKMTDKLVVETGGNHIYRLTARKGEMYWQYADDEWDNAVYMLFQTLFIWGMANATKS